MLARLLRKIGRWLVDLQVPPYRDLPLVLPRAWHGSGKPLSAADLERLKLNVRDMGFDPKVVSRQPHNRMLLAMAKAAKKRPEVKHDE